MIGGVYMLIVELWVWCEWPVDFCFVVYKVVVMLFVVIMLDGFNFQVF